MGPPSMRGLAWGLCASQPMVGRPGRSLASGLEVQWPSVRAPACCCVSAIALSTLAVAKRFVSIGLADAPTRQMQAALKPEHVP